MGATMRLKFGGLGLGTAGGWTNNFNLIQKSVAGPTAPVMIGHKGDQSQMPGTLNSSSQNPLVLGADTGPPPWFNFGAVGNISAYLLNILVVNIFNMVDTKGAHAPARGEPASWPSAGARASAGWPTPA